MQIILAAGGTGGHVFPALRIAHMLEERNVPFTFVTDQRGRAYLPDKPSFKVKVMPIGRKRTGIGCLFFYFELMRSCLQMLCFLKKDMRMVLGFSGFPTLPVLIAAALRGVEIRLQEQNAVLGKVNRLFASMAKVIYWTQFGNSRDLEKYRKILKGRIKSMGLPLRGDFGKSPEVYHFPSFEEEKIEILITGGSQGRGLFRK